MKAFFEAIAYLFQEILFRQINDFQHETDERTLVIVLSLNMGKFDENISLGSFLDSFNGLQC